MNFKILIVILFVCLGCSFSGKRQLSSELYNKAQNIAENQMFESIYKLERLLKNENVKAESISSQLSILVTSIQKYEGEGGYINSRPQGVLGKRISSVFTQSLNKGLVTEAFAKQFPVKYMKDYVSAKKTLNNFVSDTKEPEVLAFKIDGALKAGSKFEIKFQAKDSSGISDFIGSCWSFGAYQFESQGFSACGFVKKLNGDWYSLEGELNRYLPSGRYFLSSYNVSDKAGNNLSESFDSLDRNPYYRKSKLPLFFVDVKNDGESDTEEPEVLGFKIDGELKAGSKFAIQFQAKDSSGISDFIGSCWSFGAYQFESQGFSACGIVKKLNGDWYSLEGELNRYLPSGRYFLRSYNVSDKAGNNLSDSFDSLDRNPYYRKSKLPIFFVDVVQ